MKKILLKKRPARDCYIWTRQYTVLFIRECRGFARIVNVRMNDIENGISEETLIAVLKAVASKFNHDMINLSLGLSVCNNYKGLYEQCDTMARSGCIVVSAFANTGSISYPAAFDNVIGVTTG